jgi:uncharacterized protein YndB with AHSA1/START domain
MWKWTLVVVLGVAAIVAVAAMVGLVLPKGHRASRTVTLDATPHAVFAVIADFARSAEWRPDVQRVEILSGAGPGMEFREIGSNGSVRYRVDALEPDTRIVTRVADTTLAFGGSWTFDLAPTTAGDTRLTITEDGEVYSPFFRLMSKLFFPPTATIDKYLAALQKRLDRGR